MPAMEAFLVSTGIVALANDPVVWLGRRMTRLVPIRLVHLVSALIFLALGLAALLGWA